MSLGGNKQPSIDAAEHIGPNDTGDGIEAKRVANYVWNGASWERKASSTQVGDGTNTANVLKADGTAAGQNALMTAGTGITVLISLSAGTQSSAWYDLLNYPWISLEVLTNTTPATLTFQTSGDASQTNISTTALLSSSLTSSGVVTSTTSATATFHGPRTGRYFRISSNLSGGNTATIALTMFTTSPMLQTATISAIQSGTWDLQSRVTTTGPTVTQVAASATNVTLKAANGNRRGLIVYNDADKALYLKMGATASTTSFTVKIAPAGYWEMPNLPISNVQVDGVWDASPGGNAYITEIT